MAAISKETICNRALSLIKAEARISNLTTDTTTEARLCRQFFDEALDAVLEMHPWNFAEHKAELAQSSTDPLFGYDYKHQLPTDPYCLVVQKVLDDEEDEITEYRISGRYIESDQEDVYIIYTKRVTNLTETSALFRQMLHYYLAAQLAEPLTHSDAIITRMERNMMKLLRKAQKLDAQQGTYDQETDDDYEWITARFQ